MSIDSTWLRCPNCFSELDAVGPNTYGCANGHRFDRARHGYLTLLPPRAPKTMGDDGAMLAARASFLAGGAYAPIAEGIVDAVRRRHDPAPHRAGTAHTAWSVVDLGCGTGYYSHALVGALAGAPEGSGTASRESPATDVDDAARFRLLLADRSPEAVRLALRATSSNANATGVVLDLWRPLPLRDGVADVALDVFAPRNPAEYARILRPGGVLIVVVPTSSHLRELRAAGSLLEIPEGKDQHILEQFAPHGFGLSERTRVEFEFTADATRREQIAAMGPSAHHRDETREDAPDSASEAAQSAVAHLELVTASVDILTLTRG